MTGPSWSPSISSSSLYLIGPQIDVLDGWIKQIQNLNSKNKLLGHKTVKLPWTNSLRLGGRDLSSCRLLSALGQCSQSEVALFSVRLLPGINPPLSGVTNCHTLLPRRFFTHIYIHIIIQEAPRFHLGAWKHHFPSGVSPHCDYALGWAHISQGVLLLFPLPFIPLVSIHNNIPSIGLNYVCGGICNYGMNMHINSLASKWPGLGASVC